MNTFKNKALPVTALVMTVGLSLAACSSDEASTDSASTTKAQSTTTESTDSMNATADAVSLVDGVVKAKEAGSPMTAIFGELKNNSDEEITVESFTTSLGDARYEIHEVVDGAMRERQEALTIGAGKSHELKPGGDHLMIMEYDEEIAAGDEVIVTLKLADGTEVELEPVPVRTIGAGDEKYGDLEGHGGHGHDGHGHDEHGHGDHDHSDHSDHK